MEKFWMVWNPAGHAPTFEHRTEQSAKKEAERLLRENPEGHFYVLEAVGLVRMKPVTAPAWEVPIEVPF
jgi:hypothetical protein